MARNRKYRSAAIRFGPALKAFLLCLLIGGSGVGYVWQKSQINELGKQIAKREARLLELKDQNEKLNTQLNTMHLRRYLDQRIKDLKLGLAPTQPAQVWRLTEPAREPLRSPSDRQFAGQDGPPPPMP